jgi:hypothetical protein
VGGTADKTVSLAANTAGEYNFKHIDVERPPRVDYRNKENCAVEPTFIVLAWDGSTWKEWDQLAEVLRKEQNDQAM